MDQTRLWELCRKRLVTKGQIDTRENRVGTEDDIYKRQRSRCPTSTGVPIMRETKRASRRGVRVSPYFYPLSWGGGVAT